MNKKTITILIIILVIAIIAGGFWYTKNQKNTTKPVDIIKDVQEEIIKDGIPKETGIQEEQKNETISQNNQDIEELKVEDIDTSNWKTYRNKELGFEFKYPERWEIIKKNFPREHSMWKGLVLILNAVPINRPIDYKLIFSLSTHNTTQSPREWYISHMENPEDTEYQGTYKNMEINNLETYYVYEDKSYKSMNYVIKINENTILFIGFRPASSNIPYDFTEYIPQYQSFIQSVKTIK